MTRNYIDNEKSSFKYQQLTHDDDGFVDAQFKQLPPKVPYKAILLAVILFLIGSVLIIIGSLLLSGYFGDKYADRTWPVLILGIVMFIPGSYHVRIAYYAWKGYIGYSFQDIPEFE